MTIPGLRALKPFAWLLAFAVPAILAGCWEIYSSRNSPDTGVGQASWYDEAADSYATFIRQFYPGSVDEQFMLGVQAGRDWRDPQRARKHFEQALSAGVKHNEELFYYYVLVLIHLQAEPSEIDAAIHDWRRNYPNSDRRLVISYAFFFGGFGGGEQQAATAALAETTFVKPGSVAVDQQRREISFQLIGSRTDMARVKTALSNAGFLFPAGPSSS